MQNRKLAVVLNECTYVYQVPYSFIKAALYNQTCNNSHDNNSHGLLQHSFICSNKLVTVLCWFKIWLCNNIWAIFFFFFWGGGTDIFIPLFSTPEHQRWYNVILHETKAKQEAWDSMSFSETWDMCMLHMWLQEGGVSTPFIHRSENEHIIFTLHLCFFAKRNVNWAITHLGYMHDLA